MTEAEALVEGPSLSEADTEALAEAASLADAEAL